MLKLPPMPPGIRVLNNAERASMLARYPNAPATPRNCPTCHGTKSFLWYNAKREPAEYECSCTEQWLMNRYFLWSGIPDVYQRLHFSDGTALGDSDKEMTAAYYGRAENYVDRGRGLLLHGTKGAGKTFIASYLLRRIIADFPRFDGFFTTFQEMISARAQSFSDEEARTNYTDLVMRSDLLVIDDIGRELGRSGDMPLSTFDQVIRSRVANSLATIITTNHSPEELPQMYDSNVWDLLLESVGMHAFQGVSFRTNKQERNAAEQELGLTRPIATR